MGVQKSLQQNPAATALSHHLFWDTEAGRGLNLRSLTVLGSGSVTQVP